MTWEDAKRILPNQWLPSRYRSKNGLSVSTLIAVEVAVQLDLESKPYDIARTIRGVGGAESVYEKSINNIQLGAKSMSHFKIEVGDLNYGLKMDGIIGYDFLGASKAVIDLDKMAIE